MIPAAQTALHVALQSLLIAALTGPAAAQEPSDAGAPPPSVAAQAPAVTPPVNVAKLPVDLSRLQRRLRESAERTLHDGNRLKVFVDVYAFAPPLVLFSRQDILGDGPIPGGAPTSQQMLDVTTPDEHRGSNAVRKGGIRILGGRKK